MATTTTDSTSSSSSLRLELRIIGAKNVETKHKGSLFIRCYLSSSVNNNSRVHLNTRDIKQSSKKDDYLFWDETFSLECNGSNDSITKLRDDNIVLELRWRKMNPFLGRTSGSQPLARAEMPWKSVFDARDMEIQKWIPLTTDADYQCGVLQIEEGAKPPAVQLAIKARGPAGESQLREMEEMEKKRRRREVLKHRDECRCCCNSCADNELLFVAEALEAF